MLIQGTVWDSRLKRESTLKACVCVDFGQRAHEAARVLWQVQKSQRLSTARNPSPLSHGFWWLSAVITEWLSKDKHGRLRGHSVHSTRQGRVMLSRHSWGWEGARQKAEPLPTDHGSLCRPNEPSSKVGIFSGPLFCSGFSETDLHLCCANCWIFYVSLLLPWN